MIWFILAIYVIFSGLILAIFNRHSFKEWLIKFIIVTFLPPIGWFSPTIYPKKNTGKNDNTFSEYIQKQQDDIILQQTGIYEKINFEKELNVVAIEDALTVSNHSDRRRVMIDVLKQDALNYLEVLQIAVKNDDTETSHYAVSAIVEVKRKLSNALQKLVVEYGNSNKNSEIGLAYANVLKQYMRSGFLDERTLRKYKFTYIQLMEDLLNADFSEEFVFIEKSKTELELGLIADAETTSKLFVERYPNNEEAHLNLIKIYFTSNSYVKLQQTITKIKKSRILLSNKGLTIIRYWSEGA
ncbi:MAG: hypothetical protein R3250_00870 [Melioribacteraceae bacterium]|nr:hypothetical protein [Melioribacteraceae bacterium]